MSEYQILFRGDMVRAVLEGRKTQTRRVIKPAMVPLIEEILRINGHFTFEVLEGQVKSPYGYPGDHLWVRETWTPEQYLDEPAAPKDGRPIHHHAAENEWDEEYWLWPHYRATDPEPELCYEDDPNDDGEPKCKWIPSIFMPRWASRITLEVVSVRVERLQQITPAQCKAEGIFFPHPEPPISIADGMKHLAEYHNAFMDLWNQINAKRGFGWDINPWVWVIEFRRVTE